MSFHVTPVIEVNQRFRVFYAFKIPAYKLLEVAFTDPIRYNERGDLVGVQRTVDEKKRVELIKNFLQGDEAALPNAIILAANYDENGFVVEDAESMWSIKQDQLIIPTNRKLASIIDGQHRLFGFEEANAETKQMELLCSVYFDFPNALQAHMFATINTTQVKVERSLAYIQFGFNVEEEPIESWSPDKFAIVLYKKFDQEQSSPFYQHIKIAPQRNEEMKSRIVNDTIKWVVSTATIVDGIVRLISANPKWDKYILQQLPQENRKRNKLRNDSSPLRNLYLDNQDSIIYKIILNFFLAAENTLFNFADINSSIIKTVGIQALFDVLRSVLLSDKQESPNLIGIDLKQERFENILSAVKHVNFADDFYQYSGVGRKRITDTILLANKLIDIPEENELQPAKARRREVLLEVQKHL